MMRPLRGVLFGVVGAGAVLVLSVVDCAEPTQIELDIRTDGCSVVTNTGIAVATPGDVDTAPLRVFTPRPSGCETKPSDRIGTLVIYPSGSKDAEIAVRIVTGVKTATTATNAQDCKPPYDGCIVARRVLRFVPGSSQKEIVIMRRACVGKDCGLGNECNDSAQCVEIGKDAGAGEGGVVDGETPDVNEGDSSGMPDVVVQGDACAACEGPGTTCTGGNTCNIDCNTANCKTTVCGPGLSCDVSCTTGSSCDGLVCNAPGGSCTINCTGANDACKAIACNATGCWVDCNGDTRCSGQISLSGGDAGLLCSGGNSCKGSAYCDAGHCTIVCDPNPGQACPPTRTCVYGASTPNCIGPWN